MFVHEKTFLNSPWVQRLRDLLSQAEIRMQPVQPLMTPTPMSGMGRHSVKRCQAAFHVVCRVRRIGQPGMQTRPCKLTGRQWVVEVVNARLDT